jgi:hypothetical protein
MYIAAAPENRAPCIYDKMATAVFRLNCSSLRLQCYRAVIAINFNLRKEPHRWHIHPTDEERETQDSQAHLGTQNNKEATKK